MIKVCEPSTTKVEIDMVNKALKENAISSTAKYVKEFEEKFASKIGTKYSIAVNSGTSALFIALKSLGIGKGDEVIVPTFTMIATPNAVKQCGAKPVFVDARRDNCNIDEDLIEEVITPRTKAIIPVHLYGHPCEMDKIMELADKYNLYVVEDCAEAHGAKYKGKTVGSIGDIGCFSFYANKIITTGEGGATTTNNEILEKEMKQLRAFYFPKAGHYWHKKVGWNMRMSSLQAAYGLGQLKRWKELINKRINNAKYYTKYLKGLVETPIQKGVQWMYIIKTSDKDELANYLECNGVETRSGFIPCHQQPPYKEKGTNIHLILKYPIADKLSKIIICLPSASDLTIKEKNKVISLIKKFYEK